MIYQVLVLILPLITTPYLSRVLGAENIGIYGYTLSITTYFILFGTLGVSMYGQREIAYVQDDAEKRSLIFWELFFFRCITTFIISAVFFAVSVGYRNYTAQLLWQSFIILATLFIFSNSSEDVFFLLPSDFLVLLFYPWLLHILLQGQ
mgnify:CR=1 FL=1